MLRKNILSFPMLDHAEGRDFLEVFLPYRAEGVADPGLPSRYAALGELPAGTFGRAFFDHFARNGFAFPGDPAGLAEGFTTPQDSSHLIAGSFRGAYEPRRFWTAWDRGAAPSADLLDPAWDFWGATAVPLDELRAAYAVPPLEPALAA
jgi:hypothetical protein